MGFWVDGVVAVGVVSAQALGGLLRCKVSLVPRVGEVSEGQLVTHRRVDVEVVARRAVALGMLPRHWRRVEGVVLLVLAVGMLVQLVSLLERMARRRRAVVGMRAGIHWLSAWALAVGSVVFVVWW